MVPDGRRMTTSSTHTNHSGRDTSSTVEGKSKLRAISYARASYDRNGQASSITTQRRELERAIENENLEWVTHFSDNDTSGSKLGVYRTDFELMLHRLETRELHADLVIVYDISRLFRNRRDKLRIESLITRGIHVLDLRWKIDTREKTGMMLFSIVAEIAIDRAEELADYIRAANRRRQSEGRFVQLKNPPFGFRLRSDGEPGFEIELAEARAIRWARDEIIAGASHGSIVRSWNDPSHIHHVPTRGVAKWNLTSFRSVMTSARIAGCVDLPLDDEDGGHGEVELVRNVDGTLPAIVAVEELHKLRAHFQANQLVRDGGSAPGRKPKYLASGTITCGACEGPLYARCPSASNKRRYACMRCGGVSITLDFFDEFMRGAVVERLRSRDLATILASEIESEGLEEVSRDLERHEAELREADALAEAGEMSAKRYATFSRGHERQIALLKEKLAACLRSTVAAGIPLLPDDLAERAAEYWDEGDIEWRRKLVSLCYEKIVVLPAEPGHHTPAKRERRIVLTPRASAANAADGVAAA